MSNLETNHGPLTEDMAEVMLQKIMEKIPNCQISKTYLLQNCNQVPFYRNSEDACDKVKNKILRKVVCTLLSGDGRLIVIEYRKADGACVVKTEAMQVCGTDYKGEPLTEEMVELICKIFNKTIPFGEMDASQLKKIAPVKYVEGAKRKGEEVYNLMSGDSWLFVIEVGRKEKNVKCTL